MDAVRATVAAAAAVAQGAGIAAAKGTSDEVGVGLLGVSEATEGAAAVGGVLAGGGVLAMFLEATAMAVGVMEADGVAGASGTRGGVRLPKAEGLEAVGVAFASGWKWSSAICCSRDRPFLRNWLASVEQE